MKLSSVFALRNEVLSEYYLQELNVGPDASLRTTAADVPRYTGQRLAIGARYVGPKEYKIAIRVQNQNGRAMRRAVRLIENLPNQNEADLRLLRAHIPSREALFTAASKATAVPGNKVCRPLEIGHSVGHGEGAPGTLGLFAERHGSYVALSNNHVIARANAAEKGDHIYQVGVPDMPRDTERRIGKLGDFRELQRVGSNGFDAAYCVLNEAVSTVDNRIPKSFGSKDGGKLLLPPVDLDTLDEIVGQMAESSHVAKNGRTTGYTREPFSRVTIGVNDVIVDVPGIGNCRFDNTIEIEHSNQQRPFTELGDSGSVCYVEDEQVPFGMMFAAGTTEPIHDRTGRARNVSYACLLSDIFAYYQLEAL